jgi:hypothetical protein
MAIDAPHSNKDAMLSGFGQIFKEALTGVR